MLISDINTAGASGSVIATEGGLIQVLLNGAWNGGTVTIEKFVEEDGSWRAVASFTDNDFHIIEAVKQSKFRTNTTHGTGAPVLVCEVEFSPLSNEYKYGFSGRVVDA